MGFIIASIMLLNETQQHWWQPKPLDIGWHVAFWNLVVRRSPDLSVLLLLAMWIDDAFHLHLSVIVEFIHFHPWNHG